MEFTIGKTEFLFEKQKSVYHGKVRDVYNIDDRFLVMIASDRISAFDYILPKAIPFKGQVLNGIASRFMKLTEHLVPNWILDVPDPNVTLGKLCEPYKVEMVIRGYLTGHAWREYQSGKRTLCGVSLPDGMNESDQFPSPIITPATKADEGHDEDISREEIIQRGIVSEKDYLILEDYTRKLYSFGTDYAAKRGLILVDTKYEFGKFENEILLIDEIHTPDSSRYFYSETYDYNQKNGIPQKQLSKEFVRQWLIENGFQGLEGQKMPDMPDSFVEETSERYISLFEQITGEQFKKKEGTHRLQEIEKSVSEAIHKILA